MTVELVLEAIVNAVAVQNLAPGLIVHTDLGSQYTSEVFGERLKKDEMIPSFRRKGCPYDNACIESFHERDRLNIISALDPVFQQMRTGNRQSTIESYQYIFEQFVTINKLRLWVILR
ncbi:hypothetical protein ACMGD3_04185 [Lysinibacillus sphaericus]|uniref:hypothetical protein n=1 Tax=Lysinibacillus sphaericus TaxID=1421 RepID=UPI003F79C34E